MADLSDSDRKAIAEHIARLDQELERRTKLANWLMPILEPHIRKLIREETK